MSKIPFTLRPEVATTTGALSLGLLGRLMGGAFGKTRAEQLRNKNIGMVIGSLGGALGGNMGAGFIRNQLRYAPYERQLANLNRLHKQHTSSLIKELAPEHFGEYTKRLKGVSSPGLTMAILKDRYSPAKLKKLIEDGYKPPGVFMFLNKLIQE
jgi:hypothetical protein